MGVVNFLRILGGGLGTSIAVSMWSTRGDYYHAIYSEQITKFSYVTEQFMTAISSASLPPLAVINTIIDQQASTRANDDILLLSGTIFLSLIVLIWFAKPPFLTTRAKKECLHVRFFKPLSCKINHSN